jgi:hypothetical protein
MSGMSMLCQSTTTVPACQSDMPDRNSASSEDEYLTMVYDTFRGEYESKMSCHRSRGAGKGAVEALGLM